MNQVSSSLIVGASNGIGRSLALALARERQRVALVDLNEDGLRRVAREVEMFGGEPFTAVSDVREPVSIQAALAQIVLRGWRLDRVFLSAGVCRGLDLQQFQASELGHMVDINLSGVANWLEALQPVLRAQPGGGTIAVLSSLSADRAMPGGGAGYSASKAAVSQLFDGLRAPWAKQGIRLVTISPGFVRTAMIDGTALVPFTVEPEDAAAIILDGVRRGKRVIRFAKVPALAMGAMRFFPPALLDKLYREGLR